MRDLLRRAFDRHPVLIFCLTTFTFSWFWILMSAFWQVGLVNLPFHGDFCIGLARYGPSTAAILWIAIARGMPGLASIGRRLTDLWVGPGWIFMVLTKDIWFYLLVLGVGSRFDPRLPVVDAALLGSLPVAWIGNFAYGVMTSGIGEEIGWRGILLPLLMHRMSPLKATLVTVPIISVWHLKAGFVVIGLRDGFPAFLEVFLPDMAGRFALTLPSLLFLTWVFCRTRGSLFVMVIAHAAINASYFWVADHLGPETPLLFWTLYWLLGAVLGLWAAKELMFTHSRNRGSFPTV